MKVPTRDPDKARAAVTRNINASSTAEPIPDIAATSLSTGPRYPEGMVRNTSNTAMMPPKIEEITDTTYPLLTSKDATNPAMMTVYHIPVSINANATTAVITMAIRRPLVSPIFMMNPLDSE